MSTNKGSIVINLNHNIRVDVIPTKLDIIKVEIKKSNDNNITNEYYIFLDYDSRYNSIACISIEKNDKTVINDIELQNLKINEVFPYVSDPDNKYTFDFILLPCDNLESLKILKKFNGGGKYKRKQNTKENKIQKKTKYTRKNK